MEGFFRKTLVKFAKKVFYGTLLLIWRDCCEDDVKKWFGRLKDFLLATPTFLKRAAGAMIAGSTVFLFWFFVLRPGLLGQFIGWLIPRLKESFLDRISDLLINALFLQAFPAIWLFAPDGPKKWIRRRYRGLWLWTALQVGGRSLVRRLLRRNRAKEVPLELSDRSKKMAA